MKRSVPLAFVLLGVVLGAVAQVQSLAPALLRDSTPRSPGLFVLALGFALFVLSTVVVSWVGYRVGHGVDLPDEFAHFALAAGVAGGVGFLLGGAGALVVSPLPADDTLVAVFGVVYTAVTRAVSIGLLGLAGASMAHFRAAE